MGLPNTILLLVGIIVSIIGIAAVINPNFARLINTPGGPRVKAIIALIAGIIILIIGVLYQLPG